MMSLDAHVQETPAPIVRDGGTRDARRVPRSGHSAILRRWYELETLVWVRGEMSTMLEGKPS